MWPLMRLASVTLVAAIVVLVLGLADEAYRLLTAAVSAVGRDLAVPTGAELPPVVTAVAAAVGLAVSDPRRRGLGRAVSHAVTFLHELGHVLVAAACGARPSGVVLNHDTSGHATSRWRAGSGPIRRLQQAAVATFGYPAAPTFTAAGAALLVFAGPRPVLWAIAGAAVLVAVLARSLWTAVVAGVLGAVAAVALSDVGVPYAAGVAVALLVAVAVNKVVVEVRRYRRPIAHGHDALAVRRLVGVPARLVQTVQLTWSVAAAGWTLWLIWRAVG